MPATPFLAVCFPNMKHSYGMTQYAPYLFEEKNETVLDILLATMHRYVTEH